MTGMEKLSQHVRGRTEEFAKMKREGRKIIGYAPGGYMPEDMVWAVGAVPVPLLRGGSHEAVAESGAYMPRFVDTFCRSQIGFFKLGDEPLYQLPDFVIVPITDNNMRAIAEMVDYFTDIKAFRYGVPQHGGIALGLDRMIMLMAGRDSIRDVIAFPKTTSASCLLTEAPSDVDEDQLKELGLKL